MASSADRTSYKTREGVVVVERLTDPDQAGISHAHQALRILTRAYSHQFENRYTLLPHGAWEEHFMPNHPTSARTYREEMKRSLGRGSAYSFVADEANADGLSWQGMSKDSPSRARLLQKLRLVPPNCYLNDIAVDPEYQERSLGRALLLNSILAYDAEGCLAVDIIVGNSIPNEWFKEYNLRPVDTHIPDLVVAGNKWHLPTERYSNEKLMNLGATAMIIKYNVTPLSELPPPVVDTPGN